LAACYKSIVTMDRKATMQHCVHSGG